MTQEQRETIARLAVEKYGQAAQFRQLQEECAELIVAVSHHFRQRPDAIDELIEEMADVTILLMQLTPTINYADEFTHTIDTKLARLSSTL